MQDNASGEWLLGVGVLFHVLQQCVMFVSGKNIAPGTLCIKEIDMAVLHADNEVHIEKCLFASLAFRVFNGIVLLAVVTVLIPPVNVLAVGFEEVNKLFFRI